MSRQGLVPVVIAQTIMWAAQLNLSFILDEGTVLAAAVHWCGAAAAVMHLRCVLKDAGTLQGPTHKDGPSRFTTYRICSSCNVEKPYGFHHCSVCNKCVERMDHHCYWANNCIGDKNKITFLAFLAFATIFAILCAAVCIHFILAKFIRPVLPQLNADIRALLRPPRLLRTADPVKSSLASQQMMPDRLEIVALLSAGLLLFQALLCSVFLFAAIQQQFQRLITSLTLVERLQAAAANAKSVHLEREFKVPPGVIIDVAM